MIDSIKDISFDHDRYNTASQIVGESPACYNWWSASETTVFLAESATGLPNDNVNPEQKKKYVAIGTVRDDNNMHLT